MTEYTNPTERIAIAVEKLAEEQQRQTVVLERIAAGLQDEDDLDAKSAQRYEGNIDFRDDDDAEIPEACPVCGGRIESGVETGEDVILHGPSDMKWAAMIGITKPGRYRTIRKKWWCVAVPGHEYGPLNLKLP